jgi:deoxyribonucleoside regulator
MSSASRSRSEHLRFLHTVAELYHVEGKTQAEIADDIGVSRTKVLRALKEARAVGIVQITVVDPSQTVSTLAASLESQFGLRKAIVVSDHPGDGRFARHRIGHAAARYLDETLGDDAVLGIGWGRTLYDVTQAIESDRRRNLRVVPLLGGLGQIAPSFQVHDMARTCAERLGGTWSTLFVPALVEDPDAYAALMASPDVSAVTRAWAQVDVALVGIGNIDLGPEFRMLFADYLTDEVIHGLGTAGAVGDICMRFFDGAGRPLEGALEHVVSIELENLAAVPTKVAAAGGGSKAGAILGALRGGYVDVLVTDGAAARGVLDLADEHTQRDEA